METGQYDNVHLAQLRNQLESADGSYTGLLDAWPPWNSRSVLLMHRVLAKQKTTHERILSEFYGRRTLSYMTACYLVCTAMLMAATNLGSWKHVDGFFSEVWFKYQRARELQINQVFELSPRTRGRGTIKLFKDNNLLGVGLTLSWLLFHGAASSWAPDCGQLAAKRALEIAAAGGHNLLLVGPPGCGKTMLARRLPSILPAMSLHEALEVTKIYSVAGLLVGRAGVVRSRPFRFPHHTITQTALVGGGALARSRLIRTRPRRPPAEVVPVAGLAPARPQGTSM